MNIHEYQAKAVLKEFGVPVSRGVPILKASEAEAAAKELGGPLWVVKSQIHAGGRGKGKFKEASAGDKGGRWNGAPGTAWTSRSATSPGLIPESGA